MKSCCSTWEGYHRENPAGLQAAGPDICFHSWGRPREPPRPRLARTRPGSQSRNHISQICLPSPQNIHRPPQSNQVPYPHAVYRQHHWAYRRRSLGDTESVRHIKSAQSPPPRAPFPSAAWAVPAWETARTADSPGSRPSDPRPRRPSSRPAFPAAVWVRPRCN
jgi:hypothetical protein